ncbi:hypothetical protein [Rhizobium sp. Rhizsp82]|uniref:hypothetical protein n=1 Tax=Rhizobium sp. Rhizsp82 TaxID=3243057 RepID=UPI0039B54704
MVMRISRPMKRAGTKNEQFKKRVPSDLLSVLRGKKLTIPLPETSSHDSPIYIVEATISDMVAFSLGVPASTIAKVRHAVALRHVEAFFEATRNGPKDLSHMQLMSLLGEIHSELIRQHEDNPPARHRILVEDDSVEELDELSEWREMISECELNVFQQSAQGRANALAVVRRIIDVNAFLTSRAVLLSEKSYADLIEGLPETLRRVTDTLSERVKGNYAPDVHLANYPKRSLPTGTGPASDKRVKTFDDLFERWKVADKRSASTISTWRGYLARFKKFVGHDDPHRVERTDALLWKDSLLEEGRKKINTTYLATFNALYRFGLENRETTGISFNPFDGVKAAQKSVAGTGRIPFSRADVALILSAARSETLPHLRWIPWLQAQSGARVAEIGQLWGSMIVKDDNGHPCMYIGPSPDGGSIKNDESERTVPLHPDIIEDGFLEFVAKRGSGPLFYGGSAGKPAKRVRDDQKHPSKGVSNRVGQWVRGLGITDPRKAPTHSFRHWYKVELQRRSKCSDRLVDAIQGHAAASDAGGYYKAETSDMLQAISQLDLMALADSARSSEVAV